MVIKYTGLATNQRNARNVNWIAVYVLLLVIMIAFPEYRNFRIYILLSMFKDGFQNRINLVLPFLSFFVFDDASKASAIALHLIESSIWILHWRPIFYLSIFRIEIYLFLHQFTAWNIIRPNFGFKIYIKDTNKTLLNRCRCCFWLRTMINWEKHHQ